MLELSGLFVVSKQGTQAVNISLQKVNIPAALKGPGFKGSEV